MDYLNDVEKVAIQQFYEHTTMREAVKKVLLEAIYKSGTLKPGEPADALKNLALVFVSQHPEIPNEQLGANLRALYHGINALEVGFGNLAQFKQEEPKQPKTNKAR